MILIVEPIACRSISAGLQGISTNSAAFAASSAADSVCGAVSRIASVAPFSFARCSVSGNRDAWADMTAGVSSSLLSRQRAALACGSRSINAVVCPACSAATPSFSRQDSNCFHSLPPNVGLCTPAQYQMWDCAGVHTFDIKTC